MISKSNRSIGPHSEFESNKTSSETKLRIIYSAEYLIGKYGSIGVTTRDINKHANQKNSSSIYYHFGAKDALIDSILDLRLQKLEVEFVSMLSEYNINQNELNTDKILEILITPIYNKVLKEKSWKNYIFFIQQVHISDELNKKFDIRMSKTTNYLYRTLRKQNNIKNDELWSIKLHDYRSFLINSLAQAKKDLENKKNKLIIKKSYYDYLCKTSKKILIG